MDLAEEVFQTFFEIFVGDVVVVEVGVGGEEAHKQPSTNGVLSFPPPTALSLTVYPRSTSATMTGSPTPFHSKLVLVSPGARVAKTSVFQY